MSAVSPGPAEPLTLAALDIDCEQVSAQIVDALRRIVTKELRRRGAVVALSGGIDSSVTAALCVRAFGAAHSIAVPMPEADSDEKTLGISRAVAEALGIEALHQDITPILDAVGCYTQRHDAVRELIPDLTDEWRWKIVLPSVVGTDSYRLYALVAEAPDGRTIEVRLPAKNYLAIVAATNFKQRVRKMIEYYHADRLNYAVVGTPNRVEYDQGFFVKGGDGAADVKPIAHLYKTQVYRLAEHLGLPRAVLDLQPTTDTYSLRQTQEEFYFSLPYNLMDLCLYALNNGIAADETARAAGLTVAQVESVWRDIAAKRRATRYLHEGPLLVDPVF
ncbi:MAG: NAD(+) synthase [Gaiellaceae bacterium]